MSGAAKDLYDTLGALYLGATITMSLWGIATLQMYYYYNRCFKDTLWIKSLVFLVWTLDTVHQGFILVAGYEIFVTNYANPQSLATAGRIIADSVIPSFLVTEIVHLFLLFRIWLLSKKNMRLVTIIAVLITMEIVVSILDLMQTLPVKHFVDVNPYAWLIKFYFATIAATDTSIALTLIILLQRSRTGGAIPSLFSLLVIVMIVIYPNNLIFLSLYFYISKFYTNTLLAALNSRDYGSEGLHSTVPNSIPGIRKATKNDMSMAIQVDTTTSHRADDISLDGSNTEMSDFKSTSVNMV